MEDLVKKAELVGNMVLRDRSAKITSNKLDYPRNTFKEKFIYSQIAKMIEKYPNVLIENKKVVFLEDENELVFIYEKNYGVLKYDRPMTIEKGEKVPINYYVEVYITEDEEIVELTLFKYKLFLFYDPEKPTTITNNNLYRELIIDTKHINKSQYPEGEPEQIKKNRIEGVKKNIEHMITLYGAEEIPRYKKEREKREENNREVEKNRKANEIKMKKNKEANEIKMKKNIEDNQTTKIDAYKIGIDAYKMGIAITAISILITSIAIYNNI